MTEQSRPRLPDAHTKEELRVARGHILVHLERLEGLYPTL